MSGGNLSGVYHFYTMAVTAATMDRGFFLSNSSTVWNSNITVPAYAV